jgi:type I restriction enzyme S subunit
MKTYSTIKSSGNDWLGDIPQEWEVKRLKYISYTRVSNVDKKSEDEIPVRLCNYIDVYKNEFINENIEFMVATATRRQIDSFELKNGDVIITKDSETPDDIGIPAYVDLEDTKNIVCGYHLAISTPTNPILLGKYLFRLFQSNIFRSYFEVSSNGVTRYGLNTYSIYNANIPLPSISEQHIIADFLDSKVSKIDDLIFKKQKLIDLLKEERTAVINQAVTKGINPDVELKDSGIEWLGEIPKHWKINKLKYLIKGKLTNGLFKKNEYFGDGIKIINVIDLYNNNCVISPEKLEKVQLTKGEIQRFNALASDILFVRSSLKLEGIATSSLIEKTEEPLVYECHVIKITPSKTKINPIFLINYLNCVTTKHRLISLSITTTMTTISQEKIASLEILLPSLEEQDIIVQCINLNNAQIFETITKLEKEIALLQEYRTALISEVVTGKIDVRQEVVS